MGKLVLGIIGIVLLQVAFLVYSAVNKPASTDGVIAKKESPAPDARANRIPDISIPEVPPPPTAPAIAGSQRVDPRSSPPAARTSVNLKQRKDFNRKADHSPIELASRTAASVRPVRPTESSRIIRTSTGGLIPRGHTMVLVDYLPGAAPRKTATAKYDRKPAVVTDKTVASAGSRPEIAEAPKKKRSFLAKTLPAVVKKPWGWMKSLASKLN
jgi:hypothetical protein